MDCGSSCVEITVLKGFLPVKREDTPIATLCAGKLVEP